ncbi:MAG: pirin family protein [Bacilli bacterium]
MIKITNALTGTRVKMDGFSASSFDESIFDGIIDPVVMVDHFVMTTPTFGPHPHAGIYAITYMFEDATTYHMSHDNLGCFIPVQPGDIHFFFSGSGAMHSEEPDVMDKKVHALQIFYNVSSFRKLADPEALHYNSQDVDEFNVEGIRARVVCGESNGVVSTFETPDEIGLLDCFVEQGKSFTHKMAKGWHAIIMSIKGDAIIMVDGNKVSLKNDTSVGVGFRDRNNTAPYEITVKADEDCHFVILSGPALNEPIYKQGPFVMNTKEQMDQTIYDFHSGKMGSLSIGDDNDVNFTKPSVLKDL